jgi:protein involved in polysaccharide export with SLBB domain
MIIDNRLCVFINTIYVRPHLLLIFAFFISFNTYNAKAQAPLKRDSLIKVESSKVGVEPTATPSVTREVQKNDYLTTTKSPTSKVFGSSFFDSPSLTFEPNLRIATPANYILGPDDELAINVSGYQETNIKTTIGPEGTIFIPQVGVIELSGLRIDDAIARIKTKMAQTAYPSIKSNLSRLTVSLGKIRSIHITAVGAYKPGNFTVSSLTTVYNALLAFGGPGEIGTYRNIEVLRNNKIFTTIDLYQFLTRGDQKGNVILKDGDVINFPVYKKHVTISGAVKRPGIFELKENETLDDLLFFAGGYTDRAYKASIKVKQFTDVERKIKDIQKADISLYNPANGDEFKVDSVLERIENAVSINGAVYHPGEFELTPGITISGLIKRAGGLLENVFTDRATLTRTYANGTKENFTFNVANVVNGSAADMPLVKRDIINIATGSEFLTDYKIQILGEVRKPSEYAYKQNLSLKDAVFAAGGFNDASTSYHIEVGRRIVADRLDKNIDTIAKVYELNIDKGLAIENDKFILQPYDIVNVRRNPGYVEQQRVTINGEVNYPGTFIIKSKTERISDLLIRAGGLTPVAYSRGIFLIRNNTENNNELQEAAKNIQKAIRDTSTKVVEDINKTNSKIAVNLQKVLNNPGSVEDYVLQDNDIINVVKLDPLVKLSGEVLSSTKTGYIDGKSMRYYLSQAGGTTERARRSKIYVLYPNGRINRTWNGIAGLFRSYPEIEAGSEIVVPKKLETKKLTTGEILGLTSGIVSLTTLIIVTISTLGK